MNTTQVDTRASALDVVARQLDAPGNYRPCTSCRARGFTVAGDFAYGCMRCEHTSVVLEVIGIPAPKGSVSAGINKFTGRAFVVAGGKKATRERMKAWTTCVREAAIAFLGNDRAQPLFVDRPLVLDVVFRMPRPAKHWSKKGGLLPSAPKHPHHKPDRDKLLRNTCDALTGLVYDDDCRPCDGRTAKEYATPGREGATITVRPLDVEATQRQNDQGLPARVMAAEAGQP